MTLANCWLAIDQGIRGAFRLARRDPAAMESFDLSVDGFYRSFLAALVTAPAYALQAVGSLLHGGWPTVMGPSGAVPMDGIYLGFAQAVSYVAGWLVFPLVAILLTRLTGLTSRYVPLIVATNWSSVLQALVLMGARWLGEATGAGNGGALFLLVSVFLVLLYEWHVVRSALQTTGFIAAGFVIADILLTVIFSQVMLLLFGV
ncbi:hypothetical protein SAMN07250955_10477 [Arboricoccus pini]|uniref:Yip1 domain-containing protein n=1 Tax=Arboricoccus pini TaxID=1963835 RepID=A0A212QXF5_9PROT|nr:hypothetical protein [Arboricoccus pini]SNB64389.1 hypothetical protein SAMN07250955_10477 [Arboricoccus pini]